MADHREDARQIYKAATAAGAGRVALRNNGEYVLTEVEEEAILTALEDESPQHYKLQARERGRWIDVTRLRAVGAVASAIARIRSGGLAEADALSTRELEQLTGAQPGAFDLALRGISKKLNDALARDLGTSLTAESLAFLRRLSAVHDSAPVRYLHATAALLDAVVPAARRGAIDESDSHALEAAAKRRISGEPGLFGSPAGQVAVANMLGKIHSLTDRDRAATYFEAARRDDADGLIRHFYADMGVHTYFAAPDPDDGRVQAIQSGITPLDASVPTAKTGLVVSVDPKFYRVYAPTMYYYAQQMPDVEYNIVLCAPRDEAERAVADGDQFRVALAGLNRSGTPRNIHHFHVDVPATVAEATTFYASARFFAARMMLERYPNIFLMDADFTASVDPRPFLRRVARVPFATVRSRGYPALSPWRRFMAGSVPVSRDVLGSRLLDDLERYLSGGLGVQGSWMLDQNALAYAAERSPSLVADLRDYKRPFYQPLFRSVWEKNYRG